MPVFIFLINLRPNQYLYQNKRKKPLNKFKNKSMLLIKGKAFQFTSVLIVSLFMLPMKQSHAQEKKFLSAKESEPKNFGWMKGFPPAKDKILHTWDGSFFQFPAIRWSVVHMREMLPTICVSRGLDAPYPLHYQLDKEIDNISFFPWNAKKSMTWKESLWETIPMA